MKNVQKMSLSEAIEFIESCSHIDIIIREGGYRIMAYVGEDQKWNSPHISITVTDYPLPTPTYNISVEYRKEIMYTSTKKSDIEKVRLVTHKKYHEILAKKDCKIKKEFDTILTDMKKT